jgi:lysine 2,3-aminomutase
LRNYEGFITTYQEPFDYDPHEIDEQERLIGRRPEPGQEGITQLLEGERMTIEPSGFVEVHARGGKEHRLRSGELAQKWQPLGVGSIEAERLEPEQLPPGEDPADGQPR